MASRRRKSYQDLLVEIEEVKRQESKAIGTYLLDSFSKFPSCKDLKKYDITLTPKTDRKAKLTIKEAEKQTQQTQKPTTQTANWDSSKRDQAGNNFSAKH